MSFVDGEDAFGDWHLVILDQAAIDSGTLYGWSLTFEDALGTGTITIVKNTAPVIAGDGTFTFASSDPGLNGLSIATSGNTGTSAAATINAGAVTVTEDEVTGWRLDDITCVGDDSPAYDVLTRQVIVDLDPGEDVTCTFTNVRDEDFVVARTERVIANFLSQRADLIATSLPSLVERLSQRGGSVDAPFDVLANGTPSNFMMSFSSSLSQMAGAGTALDQLMAYAPKGAAGEAPGDPGSPFDVWIRGQWAHADSSTVDSDFAALHIGADYLINPSLLIGVLAGLDWTSQQDAAEGVAADGLGWLVGPYVVARLGDNLLFDGLLSWGQSYNHVDPLGLYTDDFGTDRWLARAQLTGDVRNGNWRFSPEIGVVYFEENQHAYIDSLGVPVPSQTVALGTLAFGPAVSYLIEGEAMVIEPHIGLNGIWDFAKTEIVDLATGLPVGSSDDLRARLETGVSVRFDGGASFALEGFYDGIGVDDLDAYGGSAKLIVPLN